MVSPSSPSSPTSSPTTRDGGGFKLSHDQMMSTQLSRNDLVQLIAQPEVAQRVIPGFFIRVLIELASGAEDYRAYTIRRLVHGRSYAGFSNDRSATTTFYLELNTPGMLEQISNGTASAEPSMDVTNNRISNAGSSSTSFQLNCISNSPISAQEYAMWVAEVPTDPIVAAGPNGLLERKNRQVQLMPTLQGPSQRNRNRNNSNASPNANNNNNNANNNNNNNSVVAGNNNNVNLGRTRRDAGGGGNGANATRSGSNNNHGIVTGAANNPANNHGFNNGKAGEDAAPINSVTQQEQLLAAFKRNAVEELRETRQVFIDPKLYPQTKLAVLRTMERDLGDYIDKLREVVQSKKPICVVCMSNIPSVVFLPCRHMALCRSCAVDLVSAKCPLCRDTIVELWEPEEEF